MTEYFVDTNVFLRFLTNDDPVKSRKCELLFRAAIEVRQKHFGRVKWLNLSEP